MSETLYWALVCATVGLIVTFGPRARLPDATLNAIMAGVIIFIISFSFAFWLLMSIGGADAYR
jgi:hypothetical protein